jgi:hypothetical protein
LAAVAACSCSAEKTDARSVARTDERTP